MHLILFDIDGTLLDSVKTDDVCFIQVFDELYGWRMDKTDWGLYENVTDIGLTNSIFLEFLGREPDASEVKKIKGRFCQLINARIGELREIPGAKKLFSELKNHKDTAVALATGGWQETALLKLNHTGFDMGNGVLTSSNDHYSRDEIVRKAIQQFSARTRIKNFNSVTYVGDGVWDYRTAKNLGIGFIGIDFNQNGKLSDNGVENVLTEFPDTEDFLSIIIDLK